jgi:hypothetical protein
MLFTRSLIQGRKRISLTNAILKTYICDIEPANRLFNKIMQYLLTIFFTVAIVSCTDRKNTTQSAGTTNITSYPVEFLKIDSSDAGFGADIKLSITERFENDTANVYKAVSLYNDQELGLLISVPKHEKGAKGFGQGFALRSIGTPSDYLLRTLSQLYKQPDNETKTFVKEMTVNYVNLTAFAKAVSGQEPQLTEVNQYKLFFESNTDNDYAEIFLNIDLSNNLIEILEKDTEYRSAILRFLRQ